MSKIKLLVYAVNKSKHFLNNWKESWIQWLILLATGRATYRSVLPDVSWIGRIQRKFGSHEQKVKKTSYIECRTQ